MILATCKFIEWVVGLAILVDINTYHHDAWFAAAALLCSTREKSVTFDEKVQFIGLIHHGMVKSKSDITTPRAEGNKGVVGAGDRLLCFAAHGLIGVAWLVHRHRIDKLTRCRIILQYTRYIWRICYLFFPYHDLEGVGNRILLVVNTKLYFVGTGVGCAEDEVSSCGDEAIRREVRGERRRGKVPLIVFARELGMEDKGAHALDGIALVYAKIDHRYVGLTTNDRQSTYEQGYHPCAQTTCACLRVSSSAVVRWRHSFLHL